MALTIAIRSQLNNEYGEGPAYATVALTRGLCQKIHERHMAFEAARASDDAVLEHTFRDGACTFREDDGDDEIDDTLADKEFFTHDGSLVVGSEYKHESGPYLCINEAGVYWTGLDFETVTIWWSDFDELRSSAEIE